MGGALEAKRNQTYHFDFVGVIGLGLLSALGGGIIRDVLLQHGPPLAFTDIRYLQIALASGLIALWCGTNSGERLVPLLILVDAAALGFFAVAGASRAASAGFSFLPSWLMGITTAVGGGAIRDVFSGRTPKVFERGEPYAVVAAIVAALFLLSNRLSANAKLSTSVGVAAGFLIRVLALRFKWKTRVAR